MGEKKGENAGRNILVGMLFMCFTFGLAVFLAYGIMGMGDTIGVPKEVVNITGIFVVVFITVIIGGIVLSTLLFEYNVTRIRKNE